MNIAYDAKADALYLTLIPGEHELSTKNIDEDIALDFDETDRLVGIEVLGASQRVDLRHLLPAEVAEVGDS